MRRPSLSHCAKRYPMPRRLRRKILDIFVISYLLSWVYSLFKWIKIVEFLLVKDWKFPEQWQRTHPPLGSKMYKIIPFCTNLKLRNGNFSLLRSSADVCLETFSNTSYVRVSDG